MYDVIGLDTAYYAGRVMYDAFPDRTVASPILGALVKAGRLGQKSGAGLYGDAMAELLASSSSGSAGVLRWGVSDQPQPHGKNTPSGGVGTPLREASDG